MADFADRSLGIGDTGGSTPLFGRLMIVLAAWYRSEGTIAVTRAGAVWQRNGCPPAAPLSPVRECGQKATVARRQHGCTLGGLLHRWANQLGSRQTRGPIMPTFSAALLQVAREIAARLEQPAKSSIEAVHLAILASVLYEALRRENAAADTEDAHLLLEGAIERCERAAAAPPERGRDELTLVVRFLLGTAVRPTVTSPRPHFRVIAGGLGSRAALPGHPH